MGIGFNIKIEFHIYINKGKHNVNVRKNTDEFKPSFGDDIIQLAERQIELLKGSVSPSTIQNYQTAIRSLRQYLGTDIPVNKLSQEIIKGFERWLRNRSLCLNTISCYMRSLRSLFKRFDGISQTDLFDSVFTACISFP